MGGGVVVGGGGVGVVTFLVVLVVGGVSEVVLGVPGKNHKNNVLQVEY